MKDSPLKIFLKGCLYGLCFHLLTLLVTSISLPSCNSQDSVLHPYPSDVDTIHIQTVPEALDILMTAGNGWDTTTVLVVIPYSKQ